MGRGVVVGPLGPLSFQQTCNGCAREVAAHSIEFLACWTTMVLCQDCASVLVAELTRGVRVVARAR